MLAAGASTRLGFPKQLVAYEGEPLVRRTASAAIAAGAGQVVVVLGADAETIAPALSGLPSVKIIVNERWREGLATSLAAGLAEVFDDSDCDGALVLLADQPFVDAAALNRLVSKFDGERRIVASAYEGTIGVPAVFGREHADELMHLEGDTGAGSWLRSRPGDVTIVPLGAAAFDIDTRSDVCDGPGRTA